MDFFSINKLSHLHDNEKIIFCKTDFIFSEFENIATKKNEVILITGNSDYPITDEIVGKAPKNIKKWFAQNAISNNEILEPIPIGLENKIESIRKGHGIGYFDRVTKKEQLLSRNLNVRPNKFIYSNFNLNTNFKLRNEYKKISNEIDYVDWEYGLDLESYFNKILEYKIHLCPPGNGVDTHRLWEVLYSNRIPITIKSGDYKIYDLYEKLPIIILDSLLQIKDYHLIKNKFNNILSKKYDDKILTSKYWIDRIKNSISE